METLNCFINQKVIIRTFSAGCWFGTLSQKTKNEIVLTKARRLYRWQATQSISLSAVSKYGIAEKGSVLAPEVPAVWLEVVEIIPCSDTAIKSIEEAPDAETEVC